MIFVPLPPGQAVQLQHCHQSDRDEKATVQVTVEPDGTVSDVLVESRNKELRQCVENTARRWKFARSKHQRTMKWPLLFAARED